MVPFCTSLPAHQQHCDSLVYYQDVCHPKATACNITEHTGIHTFQRTGKSNDCCKFCITKVDTGRVCWSEHHHRFFLSAAQVKVFPNLYLKIKSINMALHNLLFCRPDLNSDSSLATFTVFLPFKKKVKLDKFSTAKMLKHYTKPMFRTSPCTFSSAFSIRLMSDHFTFLFSVYVFLLCAVLLCELIMHPAVWTSRSAPFSGATMWLAIATRTAKKLSSVKILDN